jgi:EmrB/QacA subfamily drug resistance transporter
MGRTFAVYGALWVVVFLSSLDQTITVTATPHIVSDLGGLSSYAWVFAAYLIASTATIPIYGKLADIRGSRYVLLRAIPIFLAGSALCGLSQSMTQLILFRAVQGVGAGALVPISMSAISQIVPPRDRGRYQGIISASFACSSILGPLIGGLIVDNTTWRWIFYLNLPLGILAFAVVWMLVPQPTTRREHTIDYIGAALLTSGTTSLLIALIWGGASYPWLSPEVVGALAAAVVLLAGFAYVERRAPETILPYGVLRQRVIVACTICIGLATICMFGTIIYVPLFSQSVIGTSATSAGAALTPLTLGVAGSGAVTGFLIARTGRYRAVALSAPLIVGSGMFLLSGVNASTTTFDLAIAMFVIGAGLGGAMQAMVLAAQNAVPVRIMGSTTALLNFSRALGRALGAAVFALLLNQGLPAAVKHRTSVDHKLAGSARADMIRAIHLPFLAGVGICIAMFVILAWGLEERPLRTTVEEAPQSQAEVAS